MSSPYGTEHLNFSWALSDIPWRWICGRYLANRTTWERDRCRIHGNLRGDEPTPNVTTPKPPKKIGLVKRRWGTKLCCFSREIPGEWNRIFATPEVKGVFFSWEIQNEDVGITIRVLVEKVLFFSPRIQAHSSRKMIPIPSAAYDPRCNPFLMMCL